MHTLNTKIVPPLLAWYDEHKRDLPWRKDREPYHVWLSEIMLQQTRVEAVKDYYRQFLEELPTIESLAACDEDRLHKLWEGLGYYSRVRNLQKAAKTILAEHHGNFPETYDEVRALAGIGDYTAGAICSICFEQPTPAVDGNVLRVVARLTDDARDVASPAVKNQYRAALKKLYPSGSCGKFTQAMMELGAILCVPNTAPKCAECPIAEFCLAREHRTELLRPVKMPKKEKRQEEKTVFVIRCADKVAVRKREKKGLLADLWEFPNVEGFLSAQEALDYAAKLALEPQELIKSVERVHIFTHVRWKLRCYYLTCNKTSDAFFWTDQQHFEEKIALPTAFRIFWEERF